MNQLTLNTSNSGVSSTTSIASYKVLGASVASGGGRRSTADPHVESSMLSSAPGFITYSGAPNEEQFDKIRTNFGDPRATARPDDFYAFRMIASGDGLDSYFTRQDVDTSFRNFVRDLRKGQSILGSHQMATFSYGSSYEGEIIPADESRSEYEGAFYPQWDTPTLRTRNWLVGDYFIPRGITLNGQSTDDLIRSLELGAVRKASISFMVGQYVCGIDGHDLISTMFGPMPDEMCNHFPGITYDGEIAWALMKNNTLVETSLVYKNASPSSMLLRKAETLAERGTLSARDIEQLESRFQVRLPRFEQTVYPVPSLTSAGADTRVVQITGTEDSDMATRRGSGDATARELAREALTAEPEPDQEESTETDGEAQPEAESSAAVDAPETDTEAVVAEGDETPEAEAVVAEAATADSTDETAETDEADEAVADADDEATRAVGTEDRHKGHNHSGDTKGGHKKDTKAEPADTDTGDGESAAEPAAGASEAVETETEEEVEDKNESTREEEAVSAFVAAATQLASALARNPDAFDSGQLSVAARAERTMDLALIDAGCDTTVGAHVARVFETRSKSLREALGEPISVEAIRNLQSKATLGETLYEELVKDAVAARTGAQGESFNAPKYRDLLMAARDVTYVKEEIESWKEAKKDRFTPGRSVVPRQVSDVRSTREDRRSLPEIPDAFTVAGKTRSVSHNILEPRKKIES